VRAPSAIPDDHDPIEERRLELTSLAFCFDQSTSAARTTGWLVARIPLHPMFLEHEMIEKLGHPMLSL
jgi:hypothetical protein